VDWWPQLANSVLPLAVPTGQALLVSALAFLVAQRVRDLVRRSLKRTSADPGIALLLGRLCFFTILAIGVIWVLAIFNVPPAALAATVGALTLAVSLSLQDILKNLVAGLYLLVEKPFRLGDRLTVRTFDGVVESVDVRTTTLRTSDGERILVPNAILFAEVLVNRGEPPIIDEVEPAEEAPSDLSRGQVAG
jgi:small-conductance mechanosensitive channel